MNLIPEIIVKATKPHQNSFYRSLIRLLYPLVLSSRSFVPNGIQVAFFSQTRHWTGFLVNERIFILALSCKIITQTPVRSFRSKQVKSQLKIRSTFYSLHFTVETRQGASRDKHRKPNERMPDFLFSFSLLGFSLLSFLLSFFLISQS